ncbi:HAMP domain-containing histidine kinase [Alsobacter sp. SYSU M60028]|uniref:histidine kinase n=1 Tax=Alsobacter ponti TaxID=2962936 RepID=A0ABT1LDA9_9HYPH|nr:HAMP domain-containing histidine kinase [Alsobacter ponti]
MGGIPIAIAAVIAAAAWLLLREADRARNGAVLAGSIYRDLLVATAERDRYVIAPPADRRDTAQRFASQTLRARDDLAALAGVARTPEQAEAVALASQTLEQYTAQMRRLTASTERNDRLVREMAERATVLTGLAEQARMRQHASNADIVTSLTEKDRRLRLIRDIVDKAQELRALVAAARLQAARLAEDGRGGAAANDRERGQAFARSQLRNAVLDLMRALEAAGRKDDAVTLGEHLAGLDAGGAAAETALVEWCERMLKVDDTEQRALHEELAQLLTYSVQANETEQATQNIAIAVLKLGQRTSEALGKRDIEAVIAIVRESDKLASTMASLPISPLIQTEMIDAIGEWRDRLFTTVSGLREQNATLWDMDRSAVELTEGARSLNDMFTGAADRLGATIRTILFVGGSFGLLFGALAGFVVARQITRPLRRVQQSMIRLAEDPASGGVSDSDRKDELGDMARAANFFVHEIVAREGALRDAVDRADAALEELRRTQATLIQAEKMASLGQLVAGVAHEINTPVGVALTTATLVGEEARQFAEEAKGQQLLRSRLIAFTERMSEGARLLTVNLTRAADLVHSFKQVSADQVSGERRAFDLRTWLNELLTSLGPVLRRRSLTVDVDCRPGLTVETYPGALGQVLTNLIVNAAVHGYDDGCGGHVRIAVREPGPGRVAIEVADDGKGIPPERIERIFDPFFTTARHRGNTGLGLHIVYNLVVQTLRGQIEVSSEPGRGTTFRIDIPGTSLAVAPAEAEVEAV